MLTPDQIDRHFKGREQAFNDFVENLRERYNRANELDAHTLAEELRQLLLSGDQDAAAAYLYASAIQQYYLLGIPLPESLPNTEAKPSNGDELERFPSPRLMILDGIVELFQDNPDTAIQILIGVAPTPEIEATATQLAIPAVSTEAPSPVPKVSIPPVDENGPKAVSVVDTAPLVALGLSPEVVTLLTEKTGILHTGEHVTKSSNLLQLIPQHVNNPSVALNYALNGCYRYKERDLTFNPWDDTDGRTAFITIEDAALAAAKLTQQAEKKNVEPALDHKKEIRKDVAPTSNGSGKGEILASGNDLETLLSKATTFDATEKAWIREKLAGNLYSNGSKFYVLVQYMTKHLFKGNDGTLRELQKLARDMHANWFVTAGVAGIEELIEPMEVFEVEHALKYIKMGRELAGVGLKME